MNHSHFLQDKVGKNLFLLFKIHNGKRELGNLHNNLPSCCAMAVSHLILWFLISFSSHCFLLFSYTCPHFHPPLLSFALPMPTSHIQSSPPPCLCTVVLYTCSLTSPFSFFPTLSLSSGTLCSHCVHYFHVSGSVLLTCLFC